MVLMFSKPWLKLVFKLNSNYRFYFLNLPQTNVIWGEESSIWNPSMRLAQENSCGAFFKFSNWCWRALPTVDVVRSQLLGLNSMRKVAEQARGSEPVSGFIMIFASMPQSQHFGLFSDNLWWRCKGYCWS